MGSLRTLSEEDIPRIAELHGKVSGRSAAYDATTLHAHLLEVFCRHPWQGSSLDSLVYEGGDGRILGCLGVVPRAMWHADAPVLGAVTHTFLIDPEHGSPRVGRELVEAFFSGPQDFSLAEGDDRSRRAWEAAGGLTSPAESTYWLHPLRPARFLLSLVRLRGIAETFGIGLRPLCDLVDFAARRMPRSPFRLDALESTGEELSGGMLWSWLSSYSKRRSLRPSYDAGSLEWLLDFLARRKNRGTLRRVLVRQNGEAIGWYLYYARPGGVAQVVQLAASEARSVRVVLDHLFRDAWTHDALAVAGHLETYLLPALAGRCLFHQGRGRSFRLLHSKRDGIVRSIQLGDAFFTRLEGEWWVFA